MMRTKAETKVPRVGHVVAATRHSWLSTQNGGSINGGYPKLAGWFISYIRENP